MPQRGKSFVATNHKYNTDAPSGQHVGCSVIFCVAPMGHPYYFIAHLLQGFYPSGIMRLRLNPRIINQLAYVIMGMMMIAGIYN
jgi:hypothetical protein